MRRVKLFEEFNELQEDNFQENTNGEIYILVGPPAVGKSTWIQENLVL